MKKISFIFSIFTFIICNSNLVAQSTSDLFSQEGLSINAYHFNYIDGVYSTSYTFLKRTSDNMGSDTLTFIRNQYGYEIAIRIEGKNVYYESPNSPNSFLLYSFDVSLGHVFDEGIYNNFEVVAVDSTELLNGDKRKLVRIQSGNYITTYVEGIGDIKNGLIPNFNDFEGLDIFVCAKLGDQLLIQNADSNDAECETYSCIWPIPEFEITTDDFTIYISDNSLYGNNYLWDFGDGNTSTDINPVHTYKNAGCYNVVLNIGNDCYPDHLTKSYPITICIDNAWKDVYSNDSLQLSTYGYDIDTDFVYNQDYLFKVTNQGQDWKQLSLTPEGGEKRFIITMQMWDENRGLAGCRGIEGLMVTSDGAESWTTMVDDAYWISDFVLEESGKAYVSTGVYSNEIYRTMDFGASWEILEINNPIMVGGGNHKFRRFLYAENNLVIAQAFKGFWDFMDWRLAISEDYGETWSFIELPFDGKVLQFVDSQNGFGSDGQDVWYTTDGGLQWEKIPTLNNVGKIYFHSANHGWVIDNTGVVLYSTDRFETIAYTACGDENLTRIQVFSDSTAMTAKYSVEFGTEKFIFDRNLISECSLIIDMDGDGYSAEEDCDDNNSNVNPDQTEQPYNGIDDDCNDLTLDDDLDQDGFLNEEDCDDNNPNINPDAEEIANNDIDEDCDGMDLISSIHEIANSTIFVYPNPAIDVINIDVSGHLNFQTTLYNLEGERIQTITNSAQLNISNISGGLYLLEIKDLSTGQKIVERMVIGR